MTGQMCGIGEDFLKISQILVIFFLPCHYGPCSVKVMNLIILSPFYSKEVLHQIWKDLVQYSGRS